MDHIFNGPVSLLQLTAVKFTLDKLLFVRSFKNTITFQLSYHVTVQAPGTEPLELWLPPGSALLLPGCQVSQLMIVFFYSFRLYSL
jgi:hypothetical protein